jgi:MoxR-like ATPase
VPPGGGKTTIIHEVAKSLGVGFIEKHMPTMLVEDFGVPNMGTDNEVFDYKLPDWFPAESRTDIPDDGILLFDDRNQADADLTEGL